MTPRDKARDEQTRAVQEERRADARALLAVLGDPAGLLTPEQTRVWAFIRRNGFLDGTTTRADPTGRLDAERMLLNEGGRVFALALLHGVALAQTPETSAANPPPEVIR